MDRLTGRSNATAYSWVVFSHSASPSTFSFSSFLLTCSALNFSSSHFLLLGITCDSPDSLPLRGFFCIFCIVTITQDKIDRVMYAKVFDEASGFSQELSDESTTLSIAKLTIL